MISIFHLPQTPIGPIAAAATARGLCAIEIGIADPLTWGQQQAGPGAKIRDASGPHPVISQFAEYFAGARRAFDLALDLDRCTDFQRAVYTHVRAIPFGETRTYAGIAAQIGRPGAYRAVGRANAVNPLAIVIPCHRLLGSDGSLRGYAAPGGVGTKAWLLDFERRTESSEGV